MSLSDIKPTPREAKAVKSMPEEEKILDKFVDSIARGDLIVGMGSSSDQRGTPPKMTNGIVMVDGSAMR